MQSTVSGWVAHWADRFPHRAAIHFEDRTWTWVDADTAASQWVQILASLGVTAGDRVGILLLNRPEYLFVEWACHRLGAIVMPINTRIAVPELRNILDDSCPRVVVAESAPALSSLMGFLSQEWRGGTPVDVDAPPGTADVSIVEPLRTLDEAAVLLYTSGTTGAPKGVVLTLGNLEASAHVWGTEFALDYRDTHLVCMPLCFAGGFIASSKQVIASGGTMVLMREFTPDLALALLELHGVNWITSVPLILQRMRDCEAWEETDLSAMRGIQSGGAVVPLDLIDAYGERGIELSQAYGLSEASAGPSLCLDDGFTRAKAGSVGRPVLGTEVRLIDNEGRDVPAGEPGEIVLRGPTVFGGYWNQPMLTAESYVDGWFRTGDLARQDSDGFFYLEGRSKEMIVSGGLNVYPAEVEIVINQAPGVRESAVVGLPSRDWGEQVVACVVPHDGEVLIEDDVIAFCRTQLGGYKAPKRVIILAELPRTLSSKVQRVALRDTLIHELSARTTGQEG